MGCCNVIALVILVTINLITFLGSGVILAFGIVAKCDEAAATRLFNYVMPEASQGALQKTGFDVTEILITNAAFMIAIGAIGLLVAGFGFFGSCCAVRWMLITYVVLMVILLIGEIAPIVFAAVYPQTFKKIIQNNMQKTLFNDFKQEIRINDNSKVVMPIGVVELAWATVQLKEECCGAMNWTDYSQFEWENKGLVPSRMFSGSAAVPLSCCLTSRPLTFPPTFDNFVDVNSCLAGKPKFINKQNCYDAVDGFVQGYKSIAIGIAAGIAVIEVILIITAIARCERARRTNKYVRFDK